MADRPLTEDGARRAIAACFPELASARVRPVGAGWDHDAFRVGDELVFRFPRRRGALVYHARGLSIAALVADAVRGIGVATPMVTHVAEPAAGFPYPFAGYRWVEGVGADQPPFETIDLERLAAALAAVLSRLHAIDASSALGIELPVEQDIVTPALEDLHANAAAVRDVLPEDLRVAAEPFLAGGVEPPRAYTGTPRLVHNDLCPDHVRVDPSSGALTGIIDFDDVALGDPAIDFVPFRAWPGAAFTDALFDRYEHPVDERFRGRVTFIARVRTLAWLAEAHAMGARDQAPKHEQWIRNAFEPS